MEAAKEELASAETLPAQLPQDVKTEENPLSVSEVKQVTFLFMVALNVCFLYVVNFKNRPS